MMPGACSSGDDPMVFEGYASRFGVPDLGRDVVERGAFAASLARRGAGGIRMLFQHDAAQPVGTWLLLREDAHGLFVRGRLNAGVARAREIASLIAEGGLDGLSIGFRVRRAVNDARARLRRILELDLWEISLVTFPMQPGARVIARPALRKGLAHGADAGGLACLIRHAAQRIHPSERTAT
ncbi:HK97 family phage prohead protease [Chelatococcus composti]|jgi:phage prohead protease, HK97 family|uniref:Prohead serine protease domain-containing protein n=1 Tax=Chelatococcus composti TaxID=1743235 RepID=A0A841K7T8_9HYPH|nr:hypothetical protein [Chelatococcus composti]GGG39539.1 hypothetical protein GCM10008026_20610 [Chelatococcus composti]